MVLPVSWSLPLAARPQRAGAAADPQGDAEPLARVALERVCQTVQAAGKVPTAVLPGLVAGAVNGASGGLKEKELARVLEVATGVQLAVLAALTRGRGKRTSRVQPVAGSALKIGKQLLAPAGDHARVARELAAHKPEGNLVERAVKGAGQGVKTAVEEGLSTACTEGRGDAAGLWEGTRMVPVILQEGDDPQSWWARLAGGATAVLLFPGAVADGLAIALDQEQLSSPLLVGAGSVAVVAIVGAATLGAPVALVGGGLALAASLKGARSTHELVEQSIEKLESSAPDLGDPVANERRDFTGALVVSGAAGARAGYLSWA